MATATLLRINYGQNSTLGSTINNGYLYVGTTETESSITGTKQAKLYFDLGGTRYIVSGDKKLDATFTVGGVAFNGTANKTVDTYTYTFGEGSNNGYFTVTPSKNDTAQSAVSVKVHGLASAAYQESSAFLAATGTAVAAKKLTKSLTISDGTNSVVFGNTEADKTVYLDSKLIAGASATATGNAAQTSNGVFLNSLFRKIDGSSTATWLVRNSLKLIGASGITVTSDEDGVITITGTTYSPGTITFNNGGSGGASGTTYNGTNSPTISYNTIGAAAANTAITAAAFSGRTLTLTRAAGNLTATIPASLAISITGNAATATTATNTSGTLTMKISGNNETTFNGPDATFDVTYAKLGTVPLAQIPAAALERLYVTSLTTTNTTDALAVQAAINAGSVQAGDVVQVTGTNTNGGDGSNKMYFIYDNNGTLSYKAFSAGSAATAYEAQKTAGTLTFSTTGNGSTDSFNGSTDKTLSYNSIGAASSGHTHTLSIADSTGTSAKDLAYGGKYQLTAGGKTFIFTMPALGNTSTTAAAGNHTHSNLTVDNAGTTFTYNGGAVTAYTGDKVIVGNSATATAQATANVANGSVYLNTVKQTGASTWALVNAIKVTGANDIGVTAATGGVITIGHSNSVTARSAYATSSASVTFSPLGSTDGTFSAVDIQYNARGHVTAGATRSLTIKPISYTVNSNIENLASEGTKIGTFSDGTNSIDIYSGIPWGTW